MTDIKKKFKRLMVANRGEIAIRVLRAASELGIRTFAIYTYEDRYSLHRYKADESYQIGPDDEPLRPYLDIEEIIRVAKQNNIDAIHPGYGLLSENVSFVKRCEEEGISFIGPSAEAMEKLGDKVSAKTIAIQNNLPIIQNSRESIESLDIAYKEADFIGYPVMVKAASGGGGRGMRVVWSADDMPKAYTEAKGEAKVAFGDDTIFIEKYINDPKHIEVQILGDKHGNLVHLYERDCSVQRRFQKVVEIAPSPTLWQSTKDKLYKYALDITRSVNYSNAGTVEFLVDIDQNIYFIEVNPRVQVEHTITEEVTGVDIVRSQILVAMGYTLDHPTIHIKSQEDIHCTGFAVQCRITTEDPLNGFKPDYGTLIAYRSAGGFGIRLDAGSAYAGAKISPFFDSMLVKVTAWGRTLKGSCFRLHRALREYRIRGVKTNIGFLENLLLNETFQRGECTVGFIAANPQLLVPPRRQDRSTRVLKYVADVIVNGNSDVKYIDPRKNAQFRTPKVPKFDRNTDFPKGSKDLLTELGPEKFVGWIKDQKQILFTDTTLRDAHQSLLATRLRTYDMIKVAESYAKNSPNTFSLECWGGATFDVSLRFLKESPWKRLELLREAVPNILLQMLLRGSNGVGYKAYPDNLIEQFIETSWETGIDVFRIFDSLNWVEGMKTSIKTVRERTGALAEACICYTGDISNPNKTKYTLQYYLDLARQLEDEGAHILAIKDMAGLLKPQAAKLLVSELKKVVDMPIHLHSHDTASIQSTSYLEAINEGVDIIDVAIGSMSGLTSQPNFNSILALLNGHERKMNEPFLNSYSNYFEDVGEYYYPFESELKAGTSDIYRTEIPGGQYSNLRPQARGLGLEDQFETIKENYAIVNELFGDIVKVTPSSKVVGDMAMFMTSNSYTKEDILTKGDSIAFPDSVKSFFKGDLGQPYGGFPKELQKMVLKGEEPYTEKPNAHLEPIEIDKEFKQFQEDFDIYCDFKDFLSHQLYPKVFEDFYTHYQKFGAVSILNTPTFFYGLQANEEIMVEIDNGKNILIKYLNMSEPSESGHRVVFFKLNGQDRSIEIKDRKIKTEVIRNKKADAVGDIGAPLQGALSKILVKEGQEITKNTPLFVIEAMKMESTITSPIDGKVSKVFLKEKTLVEQDDAIVSVS